jgi:hypothetical protein
VWPNQGTAPGFGWTAENRGGGGISTRTASDPAETVRVFPPDWSTKYQLIRVEFCGFQSSGSSHCGFLCKV